jgi:hypothetical protein
VDDVEVLVDDEDELLAVVVVVLVLDVEEAPLLELDEPLVEDVEMVDVLELRSRELEYCSGADRTKRRPTAAARASSPTMPMTMRS